MTDEVDLGLRYWAAWAEEPGVELPSGDTLEAARISSERIAAKEERDAQREIDERRAGWEDLAEFRLRTAPTLAEVLEKTERQARLEDYRTDKAEAKAREEALSTVEERPEDYLDNVKREFRQKRRRELQEQGPPKPGTARYIAEKSGEVPAWRPEVPPSPWVRAAPKVPAAPLEPPK
jgi:hypothetical protein